MQIAPEKYTITDAFTVWTYQVFLNVFLFAGAFVSAQNIPRPFERGFSDQYRAENTLGHYAFGYNEDHSSGGSFRRETGDRFGNKVGSYGLRIADGRLRIVNYVADHNGYRADVMTNEPGTESENSNRYFKITKKGFQGAMVPGFRNSAEAPHVVFSSEANHGRIDQVDNKQARSFENVEDSFNTNDMQGRSIFNQPEVNTRDGMVSSSDFGKDTHARASYEDLNIQRDMVPSSDFGKDTQISIPYEDSNRDYIQHYRLNINGFEQDINNVDQSIGKDIRKDNDLVYGNTGEPAFGVPLESGVEEVNWEDLTSAGNIARFDDDDEGTMSARSFSNVLGGSNQNEEDKHRRYDLDVSEFMTGSSSSGPVF